MVTGYYLEPVLGMLRQGSDGGTASPGAAKNAMV